MEQTRRGFLGHVLRGGVAGTAALAAFNPDGLERVLEASQAVAGRSPEDVAQDEFYWREIQRRLHARPHHHQPEQRRRLPQPARGARGVQALPRHLQPGARLPHVADPRAERRDACGAQLAREFGCDPEEIAITRNASESLQIAQLGLDLKPGDEVLTTNQDYPRMLTTWEQRVRRDGITLTKISFPGAAAEPAVPGRHVRAGHHAAHEGDPTSATSPI